MQSRDLQSVSAHTSFQNTGKSLTFPQSPWFLSRSWEATLQIAVLHADESICCTGCLRRRTEIMILLSCEELERKCQPTAYARYGACGHCSHVGISWAQHLLAKMSPSRNEGWQMAGWGPPSLPCVPAMPAMREHRASPWETKKWSSSVLGAHCSCHWQNGSVIYCSWCTAEHKPVLQLSLAQKKLFLWVTHWRSWFINHEKGRDITASSRKTHSRGKWLFLPYSVGKVLDYDHSAPLSCAFSSSLSFQVQLFNSCFLCLVLLYLKQHAVKIWKYLLTYSSAFIFKDLFSNLPSSNLSDCANLSLLQQFPKAASLEQSVMEMEETWSLERKVSLNNYY